MTTVQDTQSAADSSTGPGFPKRVLRRLPNTLVNQIAAGEVIERPAAAMKELVENAIDAGARHIDVVMRDGGRAFLSVVDDGCGMSADELMLAVERHATSKLPGDDLVSIKTLGFRGEALPSIGAVSRMTVSSRLPGSEDGWSLSVEGGQVLPPVPAAQAPGTRIEVRDLFYATPARLKFLKTARTEVGHAQDAINRLAMAHPEIGFTLSDEMRRIIRLPAADGELFESRLKRLSAVMGHEFADNALPIEVERETVRLTGYIGLPTFNRGNAQHQYLFVNGRPVRDKLLHGAVRGAYQDFLARDRHPLVALFVDLPSEMVDVNVHPAKTEVRFREAGLVRGLIVGACKHALAQADTGPPPQLLLPLSGLFVRVKAAVRRADIRAAATLGSRRAGALPAWRKRRPVIMHPCPASMESLTPTPRPMACRPTRHKAAIRPMAVAERQVRTVWRPIRLERHGRNCTAPMSWRKPATAS
jgi:DNA mismatch repair protein MutL